MKEVDKAESSKALAWWLEPSGLITSTSHVGSSISSWLTQLNVCIVMSFCCLSSGEVDLDKLNFFLWLRWTWSDKWCGLWHNSHQCPQEHCLTKCPGFKQFQHSLFFLHSYTYYTAILNLDGYIIDHIGLLVKGHRWPFLFHMYGVFHVTSLKIHKFQ